MSGRARQRPPKDARRIRFLSAEEDRQIFDWMSANGFPFWIPVIEENDLRISRDGRTLYGERFLVRRDRPGTYSRVRRWDYAVDRSQEELVRRTFAYPIVRSLWDYAPSVARRIGLRRRTYSIVTAVTTDVVGTCPKCGGEYLVEIVGASPIGSHRLGTACARCLTRVPR